jgi:hypothetical protein
MCFFIWNGSPRSGKQRASEEYHEVPPRIAQSIECSPKTRVATYGPPYPKPKVVHLRRSAAPSPESLRSFESEHVTFNDPNAANSENKYSFEKNKAILGEENA